MHPDHAAIYQTIYIYTHMKTLHIKNYKWFVFAPLLVIFMASACHRESKREMKEQPVQDTIPSVNIVTLTPEQVELADIITGTMEPMKLGSLIGCNGTIEAPPENIAQVTVPVGGLVKSCPINTGDFVQAGQLIAVLEHPDYIKLQQDFLDTKSQWEYYREDFKRQGELTVENATSVKTMQQAQASFRSIEVKMFALKSQLKLMGINADSLNIENITSTVNIPAPISGFITNIHVNIGKYVGPEQMVCEILSKANLFLRLFVYEKDIPLVSKGQPVEFSLLSDPGKNYRAEVKNILPVIDPDNHAFTVNARILQAEPVFNPGMFVKAFISAAERSCLTLPASAIIEDNNEQAVFVKTDSGFERVVIRTGITSKDRIEIVDYPPELPESAIVLDGAYYLNAAWHEQE